MALNDIWSRITILDRIIIAVVLGFCSVLFIAMGLKSPGELIQVKQDGKVIFTAPLAQDRQVKLNGPLGITELEIVQGKARVISSPCPFKVCIGMGEIQRTGEIVACVPNRLLVQVVGEGESAKEPDYDLLSR